MADVKLCLSSLQDLAHRRLQDVVKRFNVKSIYVTYDDSKATYYIEDESNQNVIIEHMYVAVNDYENIYFRVFGDGKRMLPNDVYICYREGKWYT